jgi:hypothetical protein
MTQNLRLHSITNKLLDTGKYNYQDLFSISKEYYDFLVEVIDLDPDAEQNRSSRKYFDNGYSIGLTWAAMCIKDIMRTKKFVDGLYQAVCDVQKNIGSKPVHILYAGTGPFATLVLPLTARFTSQELQFTLIEVNEDSYNCVNKLFHTLNLQEYIHHSEQVDATKWKLPVDLGIDIFLSETMQRALKCEQQVAICMNIVPQLSPKVLMIPENIILKSALIHYESPNPNLEIASPIVNSFGTIFELNKETILQNTFAYNEAKGNYNFPPIILDIPKPTTEKVPTLNILTEIVVYGEDIITYNESGLTMRFQIQQFHYVLPEKVMFYYQIDENPGIRVNNFS